VSAELLHWHAPGPYTVAFTTRQGGVSSGPYDSLNLGLKTEDAPENVAENRRLVTGQLGLEPDRLALNVQQHGTRVVRAQAGQRGEPADALWTDEPGLPLLVLAADCLPIVLVRSSGPPALAVVHAGWRGLIDGVLENAVVALGPGPLAAAVGPGIGPCCYEVGEEVAAPFIGRFGADVVAARRLDLRAAATRALEALAVTRVDHVARCTSCDPEQAFFSHRRDSGVTGRQGVVAAIA
jgi:YfiH family protein